MPLENPDFGGGRKVQAPARRLRIAAQPFLHARPLVYGLEDNPRVQLTLISPPSLADMLLCCELEAALLPVIDLQGNASGFTIVPAGCIASNGRTLTTRIFSRVRPADLSTLWVDSESHTSTVLAQVLWAHCHRRRLDILPFDSALQEAGEDVEAVLMVGDRVVTEPPLGFDWQIDLGAMWQETTGLPFVFSVWTVADPADAPLLYHILSEARRNGMEPIRAIIHEYSIIHKWPEDMAEQYLTKHLQFDFDDAHREGLEEFFLMAAEYGVIDEMQPLRFYAPPK